MQRTLVTWNAVSAARKTLNEPYSYVTYLLHVLDFYKISTPHADIYIGGIHFHRVSLGKNSEKNDNGLRLVYDMLENKK